MGERAEALGIRLQRANEELLALVQQLSEDEWRSFCVREGRTVGVVVYHIAEGHALTARVLEAVAKGEPLPPGLVRNREEGDLKNARQAEEHAECTKAETLELWERNAAAAAALVLALTDEELERTRFVWGHEASVEQLVEHVLIGHLRSHLEAIRATVDPEAQRGLGAQNWTGVREGVLMNQGL